MPEPMECLVLGCREPASVLLVIRPTKQTLGPTERPYCAPHGAERRNVFAHRLVDERLIQAACSRKGCGRPLSEHEYGTFCP